MQNDSDTSRPAGPVAAKCHLAMASILTQPITSDDGPAGLWTSVAAATRDWADACSIPLCEMVLLVPFAELLLPARHAFSGRAGWLPKIHTTYTLARECPPPDAGVADPALPSGDAAFDRLSAARLLRQQAWIERWARRDRHAFEHAVATTVRIAHALMTAAAACPHRRRPAFWDEVRAQAGVGAGPGATDRALQRVAVEWAATADLSVTDALFRLKPAAWVVVECGGEEPLATRLLEEAGDTPCLRLCLDPLADDPFDALPTAARVALLHAADGEDEAGAAACEVVAAVERGATPVALIAEDRALVRRVRALLERTGTPLDDETGWSLATTRAGAYAATALRAARPAAGPDEWLDWLKAHLSAAHAQALAALEASWRRADDTRTPLRPESATLWQRARERLAVFASPRRRPLARWLADFDELLFGDDVAAAWRDDAAAMQLRLALRLDIAERGASFDAALAQALDADEFAEWVEAGLEEARFVPERSGDAAPVVLTPLARAMARPFATVIVPGADERRLSISTANDLPWNDDALARLGLPSKASRQRRLALAFTHLLRVPRLVLIRRRADGDELLAPSGLADRLLLRRRGGPDAVAEREVTWPMGEVAREVTPRPQPKVNGRLPSSWSASAVEALRVCPYQFFARSVLRLKEHDELDEGADKSDYGRWLHAALERFHRERSASATFDEDLLHLRRAAEQVLAERVDSGAITASALLPFSAGLAGFAGRYVEWLRGHEGEGWRYREAEVERRWGDTATGGLRLHGRIDRIDEHPKTGAVHLIDYKTSARGSLTGKVNLPLEDTQLAVYGALLLDSLPAGTPLSAAYLPLDEGGPIRQVAHPDVAQTARQMVDALALERQRIESGTPLPALGEGNACEHCEARGLCRRDHWPIAGLPST